MEFDLENPLPTSTDKFRSLFHIENDHMPSQTYLQGLVSAGSDLSVRREIVASIFHYSREFDPFISYLAINYMDRFLSTHSINEWKPWAFKLVSVSCISLALKMRKTEFCLSDLVDNGGFMFDSLTIQRMEMLILGALEWRMRSVNPFSFTNYFIKLFKLKNNPSTQALKDRATEIILKTQNDIKLLRFKPSIISASALLSAAYELFPMLFPSFRDAIYSCSSVNNENLQHCYEVMQEAAVEGYEATGSSSCTPANVLDFCPSMSASQSNQSSEWKVYNLITHHRLISEQCPYTFCGEGH